MWCLLFYIFLGSPNVRYRNAIIPLFLTITAGTAVELQCEILFGLVLGTTYEWRNGDNQLLTTTQTFQKTLSRNDSGMYFCKTFDPFADLNTSIYINVQCKCTTCDTVIYVCEILSSCVKVFFTWLLLILAFCLMVVDSKKQCWYIYSFACRMDM